MTIARLGCQAYEEGLVPEAELPKENTCKERFTIGEKKKKKNNGNLIFLNSKGKSL